jgi:hypothetical protein
MYLYHHIVILLWSLDMMYLCWLIHSHLELILLIFFFLLMLDALRGRCALEVVRSCT